MNPVELAKRQVARYLASFQPDPELRHAVDTLVASREEEALEYVAEFAIANPAETPLDALWAIVDDPTVAPAAQAEALRVIVCVLLVAAEDLDDDFPIDDDDPVMSQAELDQHIARLLAAYRSPAHHKLVRRRALEYAANVTDEEFVVAAGHAAFRADDAEWVQTGVLVLSLTDRDEAAELVEEALAHAAPEVRVAAIYALGSLERHEDIERLTDIAYRCSGDERSAALATLSEILHEDAGQALHDLSEVLHGESADQAREAWEIWFEEVGCILAEADFEEDDLLEDVGFDSGDFVDIDEGDDEDAPV